MSRYLLPVCIINSLLILFAAISIITGTIGLIVAADGLEWPANSGVGIWSGIMVLIMGILGVVASTIPNPSKEEPCFKATYVAHIVFCGIALSTTVMDFIFSLTTITACLGNNAASFCRVNLLEVVCFGSINAAMGFVMTSMIIVNYILYSLVWKELKCFQSRGSRLGPRPETRVELR